jgi:hypothetical protein
MLYANLFELLSNLQEPIRFIAFMGGILIIIALLFLNRFIKNQELHKRIMADITESKTQNPNCHIIYRGKVF